MDRKIMIALLTAALLVGGGLASAVAATTHGVTPVAPKGTIPLGKQPTFKVKVTAPGSVWIHVCRSKKKDAKGVICSTEAIGQARKKGGVFVYKPKVYTFPDFWLQQRRTYYWQAHRIQCEGDLNDCLQEGPVVRIRVR